MPETLQLLQNGTNIQKQTLHYKKTLLEYKNVGCSRFIPDQSYPWLKHINLCQIVKKYQYITIIETERMKTCFSAVVLTVLVVGGLGAVGGIFYWDWRAWRWLSGLAWRGPACCSPAAHIATGTSCPSTTSVGWLTRSGNSSGAASHRTPWIHL